MAVSTLEAVSAIIGKVAGQLTKFVRDFELAVVVCIPNSFFPHMRNRREEVWSAA